MNPVGFKKFHDYLIKVATSDKYWGKMSEKDFNSQKRAIHCGFYGLGYSLLDPAPKLAVGLLVLFYKYKGYQEKLTFTIIKNP